MFRIESYITPIILNHVAKYVKNIRPQDAQLSLWEGEASFQNLDLRLDVLEEELNLPFEFLSGHIHELSIFVPWTKITSEPIRITINTIEFVLKLKSARDEEEGSSTNSTPQRTRKVQKRKDGSLQDDQQQTQPAGSGLVNKIINNIVVNCHNIILKYVEEDIVVSMNVQLFSFSSADEQWQSAMVDVNPVKVVVRKLLKISDLTICLDKRNAAGQIDVCQEPILYRCTFECRILRKYHASTATTTSTTRVGVLTKSFDMNISSLQFPMAMRLIQLLLNLKSGKIKNETADEQAQQEEPVEPAVVDEAGGSYLSWMWNMLPTFSFEDTVEEEEAAPEPPGHKVDIGFYVEQMSFTLKNSEFVNDSYMGGTKRIRYQPIVCISIGGIYFESVISKELDWTNFKAGLSSIYVEPLGVYAVEDKTGSALIETKSVGYVHSYIDKSLFDEQCFIADKGWGVTNYDEYIARITDEYMMYRSPILSFDLIKYKQTLESETQTSEASDATGIQMHLQCRIISAGVNFRYNQVFHQVKNLISDLLETYDYPAYHAENLDSAANSSSSLKLPPPLMEDFDALMVYIPMAKYKINLRHIHLEVYPIVEPDPTQKNQRRVLAATKQTLPHFALHFDHLEVNLETPLDPDKLVQTTCQLPEKPSELVNACYNNFQFSLKEFSLELLNKSTTESAKLLHIPKLQMSYGSLLQPQHWKNDDIPQHKIELSCERLNVEFSKRELITSQHLLSCVFSYRRLLLMHLSKQREGKVIFENNPKIQNQFSELRLYLKCFEQCIIWNASLRGLRSDIMLSTDRDSVAKHALLVTSAKQHDNANTWLDWNTQISYEGEGKNLQRKVAMGLWMEPYRISLDNSFLLFLKYQEENEFYIDREAVVEVELQTQILNPQSMSITAITPRTSSGYRRSSRNSLGSRRISQPEETIHIGSERDDKLDSETVGSKSQRSSQTTPMYTFNLLKSLILNIEIAQSKIDIAENLGRNSNLPLRCTEILLPKVTVKSTHAEHVKRDVQHCISMPTVKDAFDCSIQLNDLAVQLWSADTADIVLAPTQTTITIAVMRKREVLKAVEPPAATPSSTEEIESSSSYQFGEKPNVAQSHSANKFRPPDSDSAETSSLEYESYDELGIPESILVSNTNKKSDHDLRKESKSQKDSRGHNEHKPVRKERATITVNVHVDTTPIQIFISTKKAENLKEDLDILSKILQQISLSPACEPNVVLAESIKIVTATEENPSLKEFLDMETNTEASKSSIQKISPLFTISFFGQWTLPRFTVELLSAEKKSKAVLELEDLLSTVDKREDYIQYTCKLGNFNMSYYEGDSKGEWMAREYVRLKMLAEAANLPLLQIKVTTAKLKDFYKKIGAKGRSSKSPNISEIDIKLQALEIIANLEKVVEFGAPFCFLFVRKHGGEKRKVPVTQQKPVTAADLPIIHLDSKGFTFYLPLQTGNESCSVAIWKIDQIKITSQPKNPLQRNPIRNDVFSKAAQMGMLDVPGSMVEDRQYELTLEKISAASGNWNQIWADMCEKTDNFHRTNPAFEWNNLNRKDPLEITEIFNNFTFIAFYAPSVVYNNVLICGQAVEFNCATDFIANMNMCQLNLFSCMILRLRDVTSLVSNCSPTHCPENTSDNLVTRTNATLSRNCSAGGSFRSVRSDLSLRVRKCSSEPLRNFADVHGPATAFEAIDESNEHIGINTDSGFHSCKSRCDQCTTSKEGFVSVSSSASVLQDRYDYTQAKVRNFPHTLSLVAGIFHINFFDIKALPDDSEEEVKVPLISCTISQPSFMVTQNIYEHTMQMSLFNLSVQLGSIGTTESGEKTLFPLKLFDTRPGDTGASGIPPPLFFMKSYRTKMLLLELEAEISKMVSITFDEQSAQQFCTSVLTIYNTLLQNPCFEVRAKRPVVRASKIKLMRQQFFNADRLHIKCHKLAILFKVSNDYSGKLVCADILANVKFLNRPEKAAVKASIGAMYVQTEQKIFIHPISVRASVECISEPWHRLPVVIATVKFNYIQLDVGIYMLRQLRTIAEGLNRVSAFAAEEWQQFLRNRPPAGVATVQRESLLPVKCPAIEDYEKLKQKSNKSNLDREEFYQDDLRAGAFQFVEMASDSFLPLPYQIHIIKKNLGIICWRYPQPRKMCKVQIFPVPMVSSNAIHVKCQMEYFSESHERFIPFCDFRLSETACKTVELPNRDVCANIWRVVIQQSVVSVNGECFDSTEEDEELNSISNIKIDDALNGEPTDAIFMLDPKILVGCMRIDSSFHSKCVPKVQIVLSCNSLVVKLLNQPTENVELPTMLKKFRLAQTTQISQAFLVILLERLNFHASFYTAENYTLEGSLAGSIKCLDYGFLNMLYLLEETTLESYVHVNKTKRIVNINMMVDKLHFNFGPSIVHTLLSSKRHWEELLDPVELRVRHALIPKCIVVNRTFSLVAFGQTGTTERINLEPKECHLYYFRSDYHSQELTFFIADEQSRITEASSSVAIPLKFEGQIMLQPIRIGSNCLIIKTYKLSSSQVFVLIKGQIELISMVLHDLVIEFREEGKKYDERNILEYHIAQRGRASFYRAVNKGPNMVMRMKFASLKGKGRSGDIPLKTNKNLPWLVKVPTANNEFISFWVRILREDIPELMTDKFQPQKVLITIWPIFEIRSMLSVPITGKEATSQAHFALAASSGRYVLDVPATHMTEHEIKFKYDFPLGSHSKDEFKLTLKSMEWHKFFWYDEKRWNIEDTLHLLGKACNPKWPREDDEELRVTRLSRNTNKVDIIYKCMSTREFSCSMCLEILPWGIFINASSLELSICCCTTQERIQIDSNGLEMMYAIPAAFTIDVPNGPNWIRSFPVYYDKTIAATTKERCYVLPEDGGAVDIVIVRENEVFRFVLDMKDENGCKVFKLHSKIAVTNFTKIPLCVLPFAMDHKEIAAHCDVSSLDAKVSKYNVKPVTSTDNCIGIAVDRHYDLNACKALRTTDTAFVYFVSFKLCEESDISIPIPLAMPFARRCISIQNGSDSVALVVTLIEKDSIFYLNIFEDVFPAILLDNYTDVRLLVGRTTAAETNKCVNVSSEYDGRHFEWFQVLPAHSKCYYTPHEMYSSFPDVESTVCNLTLAVCNEKSSSMKWSKPLRTDKTWEKFLHVPNHGDVKVIICDKHRVIRVSICYMAQQLEFSVKDLRSRLRTPSTSSDPESSEASIVSTIQMPTFVEPLRPVPKCIHFSNEPQTKSTINLRFFVKEFIFSLHTDSKDRDYMKNEVCGVHVDDFMLAYDHDDYERQLNVLLTNLQIDNQLYTSGRYDFPVVLCSQELYKCNAVEPQIYTLDSTYAKLLGCSPMAKFSIKFYEDEFRMNSIVCSLSPVRAYIEDAYLNDLLDALVECTPSNCVYKPKPYYDRVELSAGQLLLPREVAAQAICIAEPLMLRSFRIEPVQVLLSVHTSVRLYIALDHSPLTFSTYQRCHVLTVPLRFGQSLGMHYLSGALFGAGWVVGSLEILGSPSGLARSFSTGLRDFVSMPVEGLFRGPWGFIVGITQGSASLLRNVTAGTVNSVTKLAASVARNLDRLTLDPEHIQRTEALRRSRPHGFTEGFSQGITGLGISILGAVGGIARHTLEARSPAQVFTGMGKGIVGALAKPISGAAELVALTGQGVLYTVGFNTMPTQRAPSVCHNLSVEPSGYRIWKLLPGVLASDQILFHHEVTLVVQNQLCRGYAFLTSTVFAIMEAQWDRLGFALPVNKVEIKVDEDDKTLLHVRMMEESEEMEEDMTYTNQRIMAFLRTSYSMRDFPDITTDSLIDLLQEQSQRRSISRISWAFYIDAHLGEYIVQYLSILNNPNH